MARYIDADKLESKLFRDGIAGIFLNYPRRVRFTIGEIRGLLKNERIAPTEEVFKKEDIVREMADRIKDAMNNVSRWSFHNDPNEYFIIGKPLIDQIANEMLEEDA